MSVKIGEIGGSQSISSEYSYSSESIEKTNKVGTAQSRNSVERCRDGADSSAVAAQGAAEALPHLAAGLFALLGGASSKSPAQGNGNEPNLGQLLGFILNLASQLRADGSGGNDGAAAGQGLLLIGQEAMRQAGGDDGGPLTELAKGYDASGKFDERIGWRTEGGGRTTGALGTAEGHYLAAAEARTTGHGSIHAGLDGARAEGSVYAGVRAEAEAEGHLESAPLVTVGGYPVTMRADGKAVAQAGAYATAQGEAVLTYAPPQAAVHGDAGAFAGARAGAEADVGVGPVMAKGSVEAWAGIGAKATLDAGLHDGKLTLDYGLGAALGLGGAYGGSIEIDIAGTMQALGGVFGMLAGQGLETALKAGQESGSHSASAAKPGIASAGAPPQVPTVSIAYAEQPEGSTSVLQNDNEDEDERDAVEQRQVV